MKKIVFLIIAFFSFFINCFAVEVSSESLYAMDINSGRVFYNKNGDDKRLIASTTKIMTCIIAIENGNLFDIYEAGDEILTIYGSNIYLEHKEHMLLLDLLYGLMLRSGNDAAVVIANHVTSYDKFISLMNEKAYELGMANTFFSNPTGLDDDENKNYSSGHDLSILYSYAYKNDIFRKIVSTSIYSVIGENKSYLWHNRNTFLKSYKYSTGGKTGYTPFAGKVLVTSASKNNLDVVISSFNNIYDYSLHEKIYNEIFDKYKYVKILDKNNFKINSNYNNDDLYINDSFYYPLSIEEEKKITKKVIFKNNIDNSVGTIYVYLDDNIINSTDIYIKTKKINLFDKFKDFFNKLLRH